MTAVEHLLLPAKRVSAHLHHHPLKRERAIRVHIAGDDEETEHDKTRQQQQQQQQPI